MKTEITPRAKLLALAGLVALVAQAWLTSTLEMALFGLPLFVLVVAGYSVGRMLPSEEAETPRSTAGPVAKLLVVLIIALFIAGFGYIVWGRFHGSGLVGWLDAVQARRGGRYSERSSFLAALCYLLIAFGLGMGALLRFGRASRPAEGEGR
jgi:hypothetical protein